MFEALIGSSAVPVNTGDALRFQFDKLATDEVNAIVRALVLAADSTVHEYADTIVVPADAGSTTKTITLSAGLLLSVSLDVNGEDVIAGQIYAQIGILFGSIDENSAVQKLTSGFISNGQFLAFPFTQSNPLSQQSSPVTSTNSSNPGAGNEISIGIANGQTATLLAWKAAFTASAVAASRRVVVTYGMKGDMELVFRTRTDITASQVWKLAGWRGPNLPDDDATARLMYVPLPDALTGEDLSIVTATTNLQAGDAFAAITTNYTTILEP